MELPPKVPRKAKAVLIDLPPFSFCGRIMAQEILEVIPFLPQKVKAVLKILIRF